ncbi:hypothetical protein GTG28_12020 [Vibrio sp. OCN044]|uniref:WH2 domain-containing protein n=1 Tax=Vibrio tetraodonis subsp. pristinus TaxID=2695891 RepID=A0A6L8M2Z5_9VIBR|nr:WH2 domain-containing protein [Vibrio tetraodonis]MYM59952.1 hypothetical protein [Vibrio tetraodonis subsp. pristinus]
MQPGFQTQKTASTDNILHSEDLGNNNSQPLNVISVSSVSEQKIHELIEEIISFNWLNSNSSIDKDNIEKLTINLDHYLNAQEKSQQQLSSETGKEAKDSTPPPAKLPTSNTANQGREALLAEIREKGATGLRKTNLANNTAKGTPPPPPPPPTKSDTSPIGSKGRDALFAEIREKGATGLRKTNPASNTAKGTPPPPPPPPTKSATSPIASQGRDALFAEIREKGATGLRKTNKQPIQHSNSNEGPNTSHHNPLIDGMSEKGKQLLFENPDQILGQADQLPDADKKAIAAFTSKMIVHAAKPDILGELKKQIGHLPANEVTEKHISNMPKYCQDYFSVIRPYTHDIHTSAPFGNALCRKAEKENYQKIDAGSEMTHLKGKTPQKQQVQQQIQWQSVAEVLEKLQINKRLEATSWHEKSGTVVRTPKESRSVFAEAQEKASKSLDNETRSELLKNNYKSQVTAALKEDPIFSGLFAKIDKDAAKELESEFRESIKKPETLEKSVGDFVLNKLQTQCKAFTYVGLTAENKSLQQEIERLKAQLTSR